MLNHFNGLAVLGVGPGVSGRVVSKDSVLVLGSLVGEMTVFNK